MSTSSGESNWSHALCDTCWEVLHGTRTPVRVVKVAWEDCCKCGAETRSGIYIRADVKTMPHCVGVRS